VDEHRAALLRLLDPPAPFGDAARLLDEIRGKAAALLAAPDPPGVAGALDAVLTVAERFAAAGDVAMLEDLAGTVESLPGIWERERRQRYKRLGRLLRWQAVEAGEDE